jgi:hypothetical protein
MFCRRCSRVEVSEDGSDVLLILGRDSPSFVP